jgi:hypothetical protein
MGATERVSTSEIESTIGSLINVESARIVTDKLGTIEEVHVLTDSSRAPKQVVRDIESALMARYGLQVDHKKISIAQTHDGKRFRFSDERLKVSDVSININGVKSEAIVRLCKNGDTFTGRSSGHGSSFQQLRLIAAATLRAVEECCTSEGVLALEDLDPNVNLCGKNVVVVCVNLLTPRGEDLLTGSAVVKQDLCKAVVNATLDAVNRRLGSINEQ